MFHLIIRDKPESEPEVVKIEVWLEKDGQDIIMCSQKSGGQKVIECRLTSSGQKICNFNVGNFKRI